MNLRTYLIIVAGALLGCSLIFAASILPTGQRDMRQLKNVQGIPYPVINGGTTISQTLAHTDVYLREPTAFKQLTLVFEYQPEAVEQLAVGVRENAFWLSYTPVVFFTGPATLDSQWRQARVTIPLTDKLQELDRSIDVMFIAGPQSEAHLDDPLLDQTVWHIRNLEAQVSYHYPQQAQLKDYLRSIITRERAL